MCDICKCAEPLKRYERSSATHAARMAAPAIAATYPVDRLYVVNLGIDNLTVPITTGWLWQLWSSGS